ncbi:hypothetical protein [Vibrio breoganii]|uniref:hypothetical protein n=1 Tax=Vibrio breoganii TaxID=553239 RepID=UPI0002E12550|nr:hypothetical protein [Vibrio breoganii]OED98143.1 hypothetical protein A1QG_11370 [Vibrio breoganii ZF-29]
MKSSSELTQAIDNDVGLQSKRKLLTVASLVLLALSFSGAAIEEANTFIFKIKFTNQNGLGILLVLSIIFLMIRYYNYAKQYHNQLYVLWSGRLLADPFFFSQNPHDPEDAYGLAFESSADEILHRYREEEFYWSYSYQCKLPFRRYIVHSWGSKLDYDGNVESINILRRFGVKKYLTTLYLEAIEQSQSFFTHRENLDILAPYMLGGLAIASYYLNAELMEMLQLLIPTKDN